MCSEYYFQKWKDTVHKLYDLTQFDIEYQETKIHDKNWCAAVTRLSGILAKYMFIYNETLDCCQHNLQVQKTEYIIEVIKAIIARILELKEQLQKLLASDYRFMGHCIIDHKLTTCDVELLKLPPKTGRPENIKMLISESMLKAKNRRKKSDIGTEQIEYTETKESKGWNWWDGDKEEVDEQPKGINVMAIYALKKEEKITTEMLEVKRMVTLIQAHERLRKLTFLLRKQKQKKEKWTKQLSGTLQPPARLELRERSAKTIQRIFRAYFEIKRKRIEECNRDELLDLRLCKKINENEKEDNMARMNEKFKNYNNVWTKNRNKIKLEYISRKRLEIEDDIREEIMEWFRKWFNAASFFHDIPNENLGGSILIVNDTILSPEEWLEKYEAYLEEKRANEKKTTYELKWEKKEEKKELLLQKKADQARKKTEEQVQKKMMKNPNYHPGYYYPVSKKTNRILEAIKKYERDWSHLDILEEPGIKEKFITDVDISNVCMNTNMELRKIVDEDMREILKTLKHALKEDYKRNDKKMPEAIKGRNRQRKKQRKRKAEVSENIGDKLEDLAFRGFLKEYPNTRIEDLIGDPNFAGDDLRCMLRPAQVFAGETRALWWERCQEMTHKSHRILTVGPPGSGKTTLVHALASVNDAVLYVIDSAVFTEELLSAVYLQQLANSIAVCARFTEPSIIYIKHLHKFYRTKVSPDEDKDNLNLIKRYLLRKLLKKINKDRNVTVVALRKFRLYVSHDIGWPTGRTDNKFSVQFPSGTNICVINTGAHSPSAYRAIFITSCTDPWLANSEQMLKQFPSVVLLPETNYSAVSIILRNWVLDNHIVPNSLDVQSLAYVLQGYTFGNIKNTLTKFLSADRIIKIAAHGLTVGEIYDFFIEIGEEKVDYNKYLKWYTDKTPSGKKEKKFLEEQREFQTLLNEWQEKRNKNKKVDSTVSDDTSDIE